MCCSAFAHGCTTVHLIDVLIVDFVNTQGMKKFTVGNRAACLLVKFGEYSLAGISCGLVGQGIANALINLKWVQEAVSSVLCRD